MRNFLLGLIAFFLFVLCVLLGFVIFMLFQPGPNYRPPEQRGGAPIERPSAN